VIAAIRTQRGLLLVAHLDSVAATVGEIERAGALRVLSRERDGQPVWAPPAGERLEPGDRVTVIGTQLGLAQLAESDSPS
jgi:hypothetical protein